MKKSFLLFSIFICSFINSYSQTLKIKYVENKYYPLMQAGVVLYDSIGKEYPKPYNINDFDLYEKNQKKTISNVSCTSISKYSILIMFDKTGSMTENPDGSQGKPPQKIDIIKPLSKKLINGLHESRYETSLFIFPGKTANAGQPDIVKWWTTNKDSMNKEIDMLYAGGKTDYNSAFMGYRVNNPTEKKMGAIEFASYSKYKPIIIFLTDGKESDQSPSDPIKTTEILKALQLGGITCFVVGVGVDLNYSIFASFASSTGGESFNNFQNEDQIEEITDKILKKLDSIVAPEPCMVEWQGACDANEIKIVYNKSKNAIDSMQFPIDQNNISDLFTAQRKLNLDYKKAGTIINSEIEIKAKTKNIEISSCIFTDPRFSIKNSNVIFPFILMKGQTKKIEIQFSSNKLECINAKMKFVSNACNGNEIDIIVPYQFLNKDIDLGTCNLGQKITFEIDTVFCNYTCNPIDFDKVIFENQNVNKFYFEPIKSSYKLGLNECIKIKGSFSSNEEGISNLNYNIYTKSGYYNSGKFTIQTQNLNSIEEEKNEVCDIEIQNNLISIKRLNNNSFTNNLKIFDCLANVIFEANLPENQKLNINFENFSDGVYFVNYGRFIKKLYKIGNTVYK